MPRRKNGSPPPCCLHRQSGRAYVRLDGRQVMLGQHGTQESRARYHRQLVEWEANGRRLPDEVRGEIPTIAELCADYTDHSPAPVKAVSIGLF